MKTKIVCKKEITEGLYQYSVWCPEYIFNAEKIQRVLNSRKVGKAISVKEAMLQTDSLANGLAFSWTGNYKPYRQKVVQKAINDAKKEFVGKKLHLLNRIKLLINACIKLVEEKADLTSIGFAYMDAIYALAIVYKDIIQVDDETMELVKHYFTGESVGDTLLIVSQKEYNLGDEYLGDELYL